MKSLRALLPGVLALALSGIAQAATYTVINTNNAGAGSLRDAVSQANANGGADTIVFDTAGVFSTDQTIVLGGSQIQITGALTIDAPSAAGRRVTVSGNYDSRVLSVQLSGAGTVTLRHLSIRNGRTTDDGGGIQVSSPAGSTLELNDCDVAYCNARDGGGIDAGSSTVTLTNSQVRYCGASRNGAGIIAHGTLTLTGSTCYTNAAQGDGGAILADGGAASISSSDFYTNTAARGAALFAKGGATVAISGGTINNNTAVGEGGGLRAAGSSALTLLGVVIRDNDADLGAAIAIRSATLAATNCRITRNDAAGGLGGGLYFKSGTARLKNCTISGNDGYYGAGIYADAAGVELGNTIVADNPTYGVDDLYGPFATLGHNFIGYLGNHATGLANGVDGDLVGEASKIDPRLDFLANTYIPLPRSRCLENGDSSMVTSPTYGTAPFVDVLSNPRIRGVVDIGAIEGTFNAVVTNANDSGAGSLRDALTSSPTDVSFDPAFFGSTLRTITLTSGQIALNTDLNIVGPAPGLIISGNNSSRVFNVIGGNVSLQRIRIINGNSISDGGGIRVATDGTSLMLDDAGVSNSNASGKGGGLYMENNVTVTITNSTFSGDSANGDGGAIHVNGGTLNLTNSTISTNSSKGGGGGVYTGAGTATIINSTIADNTADSDNAAPIGSGGGIRRNAGTVNVGNTIVARNNDASSGVVHPDVSGVFVSLGHNLIGKTDGLETSSGTPFQNGVNGDLAGTIASPLNPQLGALAQVPANNPTRVHRLLAASVARDAGDGALLSNAAWPSIPPADDQRGQFRTVGTAVDIGAVEYPDSMIVKLALETPSTSEATLLPAQFRIRRSYDNGANLVVNLTIDPSSTAASSDYAFSGGSYNSTGATTFTVTIPAGSTSVLLNVTPVDDSNSEGVETLSLTLAASAAYSLDSAATNTRLATIYDNEYTVTGTANAGAGSLREAINNANTGGGAVITMPADASVTLNGSELTIESDIEIVGNHATVDAAGLSRVFVIRNGNANPVILRNLIITGGYSEYDGGGIFVDASTELEMRGCTLIGNTSASDAGGIAINTNGLLTLTNSSVVDNVATGVAGGIWAYASSLDLTNTTIAGNRAGLFGGGIFANETPTDAIVTNCTITENMADADNSGDGDGGGIYAGDNTAFGLFNTVVARNYDTPGSVGPGTIHRDVSRSNGTYYGSFNFIGHNGGASGFFPAGFPNGAFTYVSGTIPLDPLIKRINRRTDIFYEFPTNSTLVDHGTNGIALLTNDQRGVPRVYNGTVDIGAVEMDFLVVSNSNSTGAGSLRQALTDAAAQGHGTVVFSATHFNQARTISASGTEFLITSPVIISSPSNFNQRLTVSGGNTRRVFKVAPSAAANVEFRDLDIAEGNTSTHAIGDRTGAGININGLASVSLFGCVIRNCDALTAGGAVDVAAGGTLEAVDSTFSSNHATTQGGAIRNAGSLLLERVTLSGNNSNAEGGALHNTDVGALTNCTFSNNRAYNHGGAINNAAGVSDILSLTHCTFTLNHANEDNSGGGNGGGLRNASGTLSVRNTLVSGNDALGGTQDDISGAFTSAGNNLVAITTGGTGFTNGVNGDLVSANAYLGPLQNNGGPTFTHALLAGSAAIDAAANLAGSTDQRGLLRNGTADDIGAYELLTETYDYWKAHTFPTDTNTSESSDYDGDGKSNGLEFGAGSDPTNPFSLPTVVASKSGTNYVVDFGLSPLAPAGQVVLRYSTDLATWQNVAANSYQVIGADPTRNVILMRVSTPMSFGPKVFLRLQDL